MRKAKIEFMFFVFVLVISFTVYAGILDLDADNLRREKILAQNGSTYYVTLKETVFTDGNVYDLYFVENLTELNEIDKRINYLSDRISFLDTEINRLNGSINNLEKVNSTLSGYLNNLTQEKENLQNQLNVLQSRKRKLKNQAKNNFLIPRIQFLSIVVLTVIIFLISLYYEFKIPQEKEGKKEKEEEKEGPSSYYDEDVVVIE